MGNKTTVWADLSFMALWSFKNSGENDFLHKGNLFTKFFLNITMGIITSHLHLRCNIILTSTCFFLKSNYLKSNKRVNEGSIERKT